MPERRTQIPGDLQSEQLENHVLVYVVWSTIALSTGGGLFNGVMAVRVDVK